MIIAVTTFFQSQTNYGQLLQSYALQQVLMKMGHYPYVIRYGFHESLRPVLSPDWPKVDEGKLQANLHISASEGTADDRHFDDFRREHLNLSTNAYNTLEELQCFPPFADCYLTGSDQVWAQLLSKPDNGTFYLDFGLENVLRISYAPSFSLDVYPEELNSLLHENLQRFDAVSVREKTGVEICKNIGVEAAWVLDPTMLLDGDYYRLLGAESKTNLPTHYMFVYHVNIKRDDLPCWQAVNNYNQVHGLKAIAVHANGEGQENIEFLDEAEYCYPAIQDWIRLIDNAEYVLTSSFHGMVFSILLHKPFLVSLRPDSMFAGNDRVVSLLKELGLEHRIVTCQVDMEQQMTEDINWEEVDARVDRLRRNSISYLKNALQIKGATPDGNKDFSKWTEWISKMAGEKLAESRNQALCTQQKMADLQQEKKNLQQEITTLHQEREHLQQEISRYHQDAENSSAKSAKRLKQIRKLVYVIIALFLTTILSVIMALLK